MAYAIGGKLTHQDSYGEKIIKSVLDFYDIKYRQEEIRNIHKYNEDFYYIRFDFYLPKHRTVIEYNGEQHYHYSPTYYKNKEAFQRQKNRDKAVKDYCKDKKIQLITVRYSGIKRGFG